MNEHSALAVKIVSLTAIIIIIGAMLVPVVSIYTDTTKTYTAYGPQFALVGDDGTAHTIVVSESGNDIVIATDGKSVITPSLIDYHPGGIYTASAIGIGVYEAYTLDGVLVSQSGRTPTASQTIDTFRTEALAGNVDNSNGTYQLWNFNQVNLYKLMATMIMGNTDSQYMMGPGVSNSAGVANDNTTATNAAVTGQTSSAYEKSDNNRDSVSLLLENAWGSVWEFIGDTEVSNYVLKVGNTLGGEPVATVTDTLGRTITLPFTAGGTSNNKWIDSITEYANAYAIPTSVSSSATTAGQGVNDSLWTAFSGTVGSNAATTDSNNVLLNGGSWTVGSRAGLFALCADDSLSYLTANRGARLAYLITGADAAPSQGGSYLYKLTTDAASGTVTDVQYRFNGVWTSVMPNGTELNDFWNFDANGYGPFNAYYAAVNLYSGANSDDAVQARLSTEKGAVGYILNPNNLKQTLAGNSFDATQYNIMLIIPTAYYGQNGNEIYISNSSEAVDGVTLSAYAHTYTKNPDVDTRNPNSRSAASIVIGSDFVVRLYDSGEIRIYTSDSEIDLGTVKDGAITLTVTNGTLSYTDALGATGNHSNTVAYISDVGEYTMELNPKVLPSSTVILGGYTHDINTTDGDVVSIGYYAQDTIANLTNTPVGEYYPVINAGTDTATDNHAIIEVNTSTYDYDLLQVDSVVITSEWGITSGEEFTSHGSSTATYTYFLAPSSIVHDNPSYVGGDNVALLSAIIVMILIAVLLSAVAIAIRREE